MSKKTIVISIIIILIALGVGGWFWYEKKIESASETSQEEVAQQMVWYPIPELGIEIQIPKDVVDDLVYVYQIDPTNNNVSSVLLSTKTLISIDGNNCSPKHSPVGILSRGKGKQSDSRHKDSHAGETVAVLSFNSFFIYYDGPQSPCVFNQMAYDNINKVTAVFNAIFLAEQYGLSIEEWHSKVRELGK
jgi:hypothetical protein